jgi:hypothetical protein
MPKQRICAYCQKNSKLTREHIWPSCLISRMPELQVNYLGNKHVLMAGDLVVADVCADCNNKKLSALDAYFCSLYDQYFKNFKEDLTPFTFTYDYDMLLRSLLKITYNSSRTVTRESNDFEKYREYILKGDEIHPEILVKLDIVQPTIIDGRKFYPSSARCGAIQLSGPMPNFLVRFIAVNSFYFYIILSKSAVLKNDMEEEFYRIFDNLQGTIVHPYRQEVIVDTFSDIDAQGSHLDLLANTHDIYLAYKDKKRR